jgi:hypothetical protein
MKIKIEKRDSQLMRRHKYNRSNNIIVDARQTYVNISMLNLLEQNDDAVMKILNKVPFYRYLYLKNIKKTSTIDDLDDVKRNPAMLFEVMRDINMMNMLAIGNYIHQELKEIVNVEDKSIISRYVHFGKIGVETIFSEDEYVPFAHTCHNPYIRHARIAISRLMTSHVDDTLVTIYEDAISAIPFYEYIYRRLKNDTILLNDWKRIRDDEAVIIEIRNDLSCRNDEISEFIKRELNLLF